MSVTQELHRTERATSTNGGEIVDVTRMGRMRTCIRSLMFTTKAAGQVVVSFPAALAFHEPSRESEQLQSQRVNILGEQTCRSKPGALHSCNASSSYLGILHPAFRAASHSLVDFRPIRAAHAHVFSLA